MIIWCRKALISVLAPELWGEKGSDSLTLVQQ